VQILIWADTFHERTGRWPNVTSGFVEGDSGLTWRGVNTLLDKGLRGLPGNSSLAQLLTEHRGLRNPKNLPVLTLGTILAWAVAHRERTGQWPKQDSGAVAESPSPRARPRVRGCCLHRRGGDAGLDRCTPARRPSVRRVRACLELHRRTATGSQEMAPVDHAPRGQPADCEPSGAAHLLGYETGFRLGQLPADRAGRRRSGPGSAAGVARTSCTGCRSRCGW